MPSRTPALCRWLPELALTLTPAAGAAGYSHTYRIAPLSAVDRVQQWGVTIGAEPLIPGSRHIDEALRMALWHAHIRRHQAGHGPMPPIGTGRRPDVVDDEWRHIGRPEMERAW